MLKYKLFLLLLDIVWVVVLMLQVSLMEILLLLIAEYSRGRNANALGWSGDIAAAAAAWNTYRLEIGGKVV